MGSRSPPAGGLALTLRVDRWVGPPEQVANSGPLIWSFLQVVVRELQETLPIVLFDRVAAFADMVTDLALDDRFANRRGLF